jgi:membrane protein YdbS with pleckstrin-like domain
MTSVRSTFYAATVFLTISTIMTVSGPFAGQPWWSTTANAMLLVPVLFFHGWVYRKIIRRK